jgi:hypothetical protein
MSEQNHSSLPPGVTSLTERGFENFGEAEDAKRERKNAKAARRRAEKRCADE